MTTRGRTQPTQTLYAVGGAICPHDPDGRAGRLRHRSAAEIVTAALQDHHRATVVGTHTFGKGVFQEEMPLSNGGALDITVGEYFTPNGRNLGGGGVKQGAGVTARSAGRARRRHAARARGRAEYARGESAVSRPARGVRAVCARSLGRRGAARAAERRRRVGAAGGSAARRGQRRRSQAPARGRAREPRRAYVIGPGRASGAAGGTCSCRRARAAPDVARVRDRGADVATWRGADARPRLERARRAASARRSGGTRCAHAARPARAGDVHDRPGERARLRRRDLGRGDCDRRRRARVGAHRRRRARTCPRARSSTARRAGARRACTCRARSSRCCRRRCPTTPARSCRGPSARRSPSSWSSTGREVVRAAFYRSLIRSDARLDYERVDRIFAGAGARRGAVGAPLRARARGRARRCGTSARAGAARWRSTPQEPEFDLRRARDTCASVARARRPSRTA